MLPFCTLNGSTILHVQDAPLRWWCEDIVWTNLRKNYFSFTHTLFCVCSDSGMSRCSLASTLSWVSLRQPVSEKCFYFPTEKFQLSKQNDKKLYPAHESRGRNGPTKWCRWMATFLRRVNASDFPSSGVRCAGRLQQGIVCKRHDAFWNRKNAVFVEHRIYFFLCQDKSYLLNPEPETESFFSFYPFCSFFFGFRSNDSNNPLCPRHADALMACRQNVYWRRKCIFLV